MNTPKQYRQGDILFLEIDSLPTKRKRLEHGVVAEGEITGHKHQIADDAALLYEDGTVKFLEALRETSIVHEEHKEIILPKGFYRVVQQRQYTPGRVEPVRD